MGRGVPRGDRGRRKDAGRAEPPLHAPGIRPRRCGLKPSRNLRPPARGAHLGRPPLLEPRGPSPGPPALPSGRTPALTCTARLGHVPGGGLQLCSPAPRDSRARLRSQAASGPSGLRAPRPAPPPRALGCRHRSRRRLAAPSRSLKGAERRPRRPPRRRGGTDGGRRPTRPRGPALRRDRGRRSSPLGSGPRGHRSALGATTETPPGAETRSRDRARDTRHCSPDTDGDADWESGAQRH